MKPEDLGIAGFTPASVLVKPPAKPEKRDDKLIEYAQEMTKAANTIAAQRGFLERARLVSERFAIENLFLKKALEELRVHRAVLFGLLILAVLLWRL